MAEEEKSEARKAYLENSSKWNEHYQEKPLSLRCVKISGPNVDYKNPFTVSEDAEKDNLVISGLVEEVQEEVGDIAKRRGDCKITATFYKTNQKPNYEPESYPGLKDNVWQYKYKKIGSRELWKDFSLDGLESIVKNAFSEESITPRPLSGIVGAL